MSIPIERATYILTTANTVMTDYFNEMNSGTTIERSMEIAECVNLIKLIVKTTVRPYLKDILPRLSPEQIELFKEQGII